MRDITTAFSTALDQRQIKMAVFIKAEFDVDDVLMWSGLGNIVYDGQVYIGGAKILEVSPIRETQQIEAVGVSFKLSAIKSEDASLVLSQNSRNRPVSIWLAVDSGGTWEMTPSFKGHMDVMSLEYEGETATATITAENDLARLTNELNEYYTAENQKAKYEGDLGLDFIATIEDRQITWGQN